MRKKLTCLFISLILITAFSLSACQSNKKASDNTTDHAGSAATENMEDSKNTETKEGSNTQADASSSDSQTEEKVPAVDFEVKLVSGETVKLSDYLGKKVLVNFWATWCGPCVQEMPAFQRLSEDYPDDVVILAVNCGDSASDVEDFVKDNGYTFNIAIDETLEASSLYPTSSIPLTLIIDEDGYVTYASYGASDADTMYELYKQELGL